MKDFIDPFIDKLQNYQVKDDEETYPQSSEISTPHATSTQNVMYCDYAPGAEVVIDSEYDSVRSETMTDNLSLDQFFSRPVLVNFYEWQVGTGGFLNLSTFNPWKLFFENKRVINRIANYKLLQAKLHIRVLINGTPFHFGRALLAYTPLHNFDDVGTRTLTGSSANIVNLSQKPHLFLNPTTCQGGDMTLPFLFYSNALNIVNNEWDQMGEMDLYSLTPLRHANGGTTDVQISIFAWATDVKLSAPTNANPGSILPQADEYGVQTFSVRASNLANMMGNMASAPVIGPYARATSLAAAAASNIAALFGFSKPSNVDRTIVNMQSTGPMAVTNNLDDAIKLSLDAKQEVTVDPRSFGLSNKDEMDIQHVASRESILTSFSWDPGNSQPAGTILWNCVVDPMLYISTSATGLNIPRLNLTAMGFAAMPFQYWRGSIIYRFQVVCSAMHRGRIRIVYDPESEVSFNDPTVITPAYNLGYSTVVDISETKDFSVTVGWAQSTTYREHIKPDTPSTQIHAIVPVPYDSSTSNFGNGVLGVYIVNELTTPSASADSIQIIVSVSAGPDFELAAPTSQYLSNLRYRTYDNIPIPPGFAPILPDIPEVIEEEPIEPQSEETEANASFPTLTANTEECENPINTVAQLGDLTGAANMVHFGESIRSFRTLLKRYTQSEFIGFKNTNSDFGNFSRIYRRALPIEPGYTVHADINSTVPYLVNSKYYVYGFLTPLRYISSGYVGVRGGVRWKLSTYGCCNEVGPMIVSRASGCTPETNSGIVTTASNYASAAAMKNYNTLFDQLSGNDGILIENGLRNPIPTFEVPYYSRYRFSPSRSLTRYNDSIDSEFFPCWKFQSYFEGLNNLRIRPVSTYCAAAEDYSLGMFIGAPVVYLEAIPP